MYSRLPAFVLGFHGCDKKIGEAIRNEEVAIRPSKNDYDWLGHGSYFWEANPVRALEYAKYLMKNPARTQCKINKPFAIGAVIDLGNCLNLLESKSLQVLKAAYDLIHSAALKTGVKLPENRVVDGEPLVRRLDCAVVEAVHRYNEEKKERPYDSVRGVFMEGAPLYPGTEFRERNHIQICVRNPRCIKGFFLIRD